MEIYLIKTYKASANCKVNDGKSITKRSEHAM